MAVRPAWEVREEGGVTSWFHVRLSFTDGARVDALAVVADGRVSVEDVEARPALSLADLTALADWIGGPLFVACGVEVRGSAGREPGECAPEGAEGARRADAPTERAGDGGRGSAEAAGADGDGDAGRAGCDEDGDAGHTESEGDGGAGGARRARPAWPRGVEGCRSAAREYRAAQKQGRDPVLAVMAATGHSRRRSLRLIAQARDAGFLAPRHTRR